MSPSSIERVGVYSNSGKSVCAIVSVFLKLLSSFLDLGEFFDVGWRVLASITVSNLLRLDLANSEKEESVLSVSVTDVSIFLDWFKSSFM